MDFDEFYAERVQHFDDERRVFADYRALILPDKVERHTLEWETKQQGEATDNARVEIEKLDQVLKKIQLEISSVKQQVEIGKESKAARQAQISKMAALGSHIEKDVTFFIPERFNTKSDAVVQGVANGVTAGMAVTRADHQIRKKIRSGEVVALENRLAEETTKATSYLHQLRAAIHDVEEDQYRGRVSHAEDLKPEFATAERVRLEVEKSEFQCFLSAAELLKLRLRILISQREEMEELEKLQTDKLFFVEREEKAKQELVLDMGLMQRRMKEELNDCQMAFQQQLDSLNRQLRKKEAEETHLLSVNSVKKKKQEYLEKVLVDAKERYTQLCRRNALEMEGFQTEAAMLRKQLTHLQRVYAARQQQQQQQEKENDVSMKHYEEQQHDLLRQGGGRREGGEGGDCEGSARDDALGADGGIVTATPSSSGATKNKSKSMSSISLSSHSNSNNTSLSRSHNIHHQQQQQPRREATSSVAAATKRQNSLGSNTLRAASTASSLNKRVSTGVPGSINRASAVFNNVKSSGYGQQGKRTIKR